MPKALKKTVVASDGDGGSDEVQTIFGDLVTFVMMLFILLFVLSYNEEKTQDFITEFQITFGEKVEVKNMNSFRSVFRAINFEIERQTDVLTSGERIIQETRGWNESKGTTFSQRSKESAHDYRYFPDPDLPNIYINDELLNEIKLSLPELRNDRIKYIKTNFDLNDQSINILCSNLDLYNL